MLSRAKEGIEYVLLGQLFRNMRTLHGVRTDLPTNILAGMVVLGIRVGCHRQPLRMSAHNMMGFHKSLSGGFPVGAHFLADVHGLVAIFKIISRKVIRNRAEGIFKRSGRQVHVDKHKSPPG